MRRASLATVGFLLLVLGSSPSRPLEADDINAPSKNRNYPEAPRSETIDVYHGVKVPDPYRPLEDPDSPATRAWVEAENTITNEFLDAIPQRGALRDRLTRLWDYEKFSPPRQEGGRLFFTHNTGLQNQGVLHTLDDPKGEPRPLLDPNTLSSDGTVALAGTVPSDDGALLAYGVAAAGSDWNEWRVRNVNSGKDLDDRLNWIKFSSAAWTPDAKGFFYGRFPTPQPGQDLKAANYFQKVYYHRLGTPQADDLLAWEDSEHKEWEAAPEVTDDGKYLILTLSKGTDSKHRVMFRPIDAPRSETEYLVGEFDAEYEFIDNDGPTFWFKTNRNAPRGRVVAINIHDDAPEKWVELIPEADDALEAVDVVGGRFLARYLKDAHTVVKVFDLKGAHLHDVALPGLGTAVGFNGKRSDRQTFYGFTSYTTPTSIYAYDVQNNASTLWRKPKLTFNPDDYETKQVFYPSKDGTRVPMFLTARKGIQQTGANPTMLYGYGGFNIPLTPAFSPTTLAWMERGGIYAVANLRGGGEYGEAWHQAGARFNKQNVFDDFISAAQWLIAEKYTSTPKLAISGRSNGGLLVGACMTQRPELFGACLPGVGVMDMLRFHKFTIGWAWVDDYGSSDDPDQFKNLLAYSPLHNLKPGTCYPPTLITTADHDDRVVPAHSFKFAAALQAAQSCHNPTLIRIETKAGHGAGKPTTKLIEEAADQMAFLINVLNVKTQP